MEKEILYEEALKYRKDNIYMDSLENAIKTCSIVGGFIILFSLIKEILINNNYSQILFNNFPKAVGVICKFNLLVISEAVKLNFFCLIA